MTREKFKLELKKIGWNINEFCKYLDINQSTISRKKEISTIYVRVLELLKDDELKALQIKKKIIEELEKEKNK